MSGFSFRRRRTPDPNRPGTIYRSKPTLGRVRGLSSGPPYLNRDAGSSAGGSGSAAGSSSVGGSSSAGDSGSAAGSSSVGGASSAGGSGSFGAGVGGGAPVGVGSMYEDYGGRPVSQYGQLLDDPGYGEGPGQYAGFAGPGSGSAGPGSGSAGPGSGSAGPGSGSTDGYAGSPGSAGSARQAGSAGSGSGPRNGFEGQSRQPNAGYGPAYGQGGDGAAGAGAGGPGDRYSRPGRSRLSRPRFPRPRLSLIALVVVVIVIGYPVLLGVTAWKNLNRVDAVGPAHKISDTASGSGRTYLVVGSDSRANLTAAERKKLGTGSVAGARTDTIMLLHTGGGATTLVSIPRDSYVPIPGHGYNKINAAYAFGGAPLLIRTVENVTGVRVDQYVETGLEGFANVVDALGGVVLCPKFNMDDKDAHINLKKGCQLMNGATALGYARARHSDPRGDLGRVERQRETLTAIAKKTLSPATLIQPWKAFPAARASGGALTVDSSMSPFGLAQFVLAMKSVAGGSGISMTVPVSNPNLQTSAGDAVEWNKTEALALFKALRDGNTAELKRLATS